MPDATRLQLIWITAALVAVSIARLVRRRARRFPYAFLAFSVVALAISLAPR